MGRQFPWTPVTEHQLIAMVLTKGGHIVTKTKSNDVWTEIYEALYALDTFAGLKEYHYTKGKCQTFKTKYGSILSDVQTMMDTGNKSKYGGELSSIYQNAEQPTQPLQQLQYSHY